MTKGRITDKLLDEYQISLQCEEILADERTEYQHIQIVRTSLFGNTLLLDGVIQLTELDNPGYHEMITHVPMLANDNPRSVLIVGGGDGGTLQQALKYQTVECAIVCELDRRVVELCEEFFPSFGKPFHDPRVELVIEDAFQYLAHTDRKFDVIIADTTDPIGEAEKLFTPEFYRLMANALAENGAVTTQCEQMYFNTGLIKRMIEIGRDLTQYATYYYTCVPTYPGGTIGFLYMSDGHWEKGFGKPPPGSMRYFNHEVHRAAFALPEFLKEALR